MRLPTRNMKRAKRITPILTTYALTVGDTLKDMGEETALSDLVADMMHFCDWKSIPWENVVRRATNHHMAEQTEE